ncbi:MAG: 2,3-bisphosphoglycerate-independent phosphoglycerate mutase, partial [Candidatus Hydrogenedentes bacterium]|nr:2,3-bisphosphoglycerate-independent phosphoglycerate mutase [Candidatus Hydrogenedentota bacterium]
MKDHTLKKLAGYKEFSGPVVFMVLDGVGLGKQDESDGVWLAYTPLLDELMKEPLYTTLKAHGKAVGMPSDDDMGNSEVGHNALGAGRVFDQGAKLVNAAIEKGQIWKGDAWKEVMARAQQGGTVHLMGVLSDGNVHSHIDHVFALLDQCAKEDVARVRIHMLTDGRDVEERTALDYVRPLEAKLKALSADGRDYRIAS